MITVKALAKLAFPKGTQVKIFLNVNRSVRATVATHTLIQQRYLLCPYDLCLAVATRARAGIHDVPGDSRSGSR